MIADAMQCCLLPQEIVEWISAGMNFCDHFVEVVSEFVNTDFLFGGYEDARCVVFAYPHVFQFLQSIVFLLLGFKGKFIVFFVPVLIDLVEWPLCPLKFLRQPLSVLQNSGVICPPHASVCLLLSLRQECF